LPSYFCFAFEAKGSPSGSLTGSASMSARRATVRPGLPPRRIPTTPVRATPGRTSMPRPRKWSTTRRDVRVSWSPSSGCWWMRVRVYHDAPVTLPRHRHRQRDQLPCLRVQPPGFCAGFAQPAIGSKRFGAGPAEFANPLQELLVVVVPIEDHARLPSTGVVPAHVAAAGIVPSPAKINSIRGNRASVNMMFSFITLAT